MLTKNILRGLQHTRKGRKIENTVQALVNISAFLWHWYDVGQKAWLKESVASHPLSKSQKRSLAKDTGRLTKH